MSEIVITYQQASLSGDVHSFIPYFQAERGEELIIRVSVVLSGMAAKIATGRLEQNGVQDAGETLNRVLLRYGVRRMEGTIRDLLAGHTKSDDAGGTWTLTHSDVPELLALATSKSCDYQRRSQRALFCLTPAPTDNMAVYQIDGFAAAPTSRAVCRTCDLPDTDYLCSNLLHPQVGSTQTMGIPLQRNVFRALCDLGRSEAGQPDGCRAGGHPCWQRLVEIEAPAAEPISPLGLAESFDFLDALWRLAFGRNKRLLALNTATGSAALSLGCTNRVEFESRLSALADTIAKLKIDKALLSSDLPEDDQPKGSLDGLEKILLHQLPEERHTNVLRGLRTLRTVCQARNALQHGITEGGGLTAKLRELGIHDAPPNWTAAWDTIRVQTTNALIAVRVELRQWIDSN